MDVACRCQRNIVTLLIEKGAKAEIRENEGKTALTWAREMGFKEVAKVPEEKQQLQG